MKKILVAATILVSLGSAFSAFAQESKRSVNPGEDPNEAMTSQGAAVATVGECKECLARLKHMRLSDPTAAQPATGSGQNQGTGSKANEGTN
ncbi:DUF2059 domain-containing protein [Bdellovibrio svalbardensis]|uniref:Secreted protein n=1 Tax=Bdellovibrio svalbardensis TaxID=2972972 RepID=A0ABT6DI96_9BACT|nr:hypothetical protein [Bdellovibrio svalbardensis]MDG0814833.1 hypothetical protein [Bdellovibrio svalbardensis]